MKKDTTMFGEKVKTKSMQKGIIIYTYENKYEDTNWFTMAMIMFENGNKKAFNLDELIHGWC